MLTPRLGILQHTLNNLTSLPGLASLNLNPRSYGAGLNANHVLVSVIGLEIRNGFGLLSPWIPDNRVLKILTHNIEPRLTPFKNRSSVLRDFVVDSIGFPGYCYIC